MTDPRDLYRDPRLSDMDPRYRDEPGVDTRSPSRAEAEARNTMWGWVAGIIAAIFIVAIVYGFANNNQMTATTNNPAATTGSATTAPGMNKPPSETTGSGTSAPMPNRAHP